MLNISDYVQDLQYPHMLSLALDYGTEIMWCDTGGPNNTLEWHDHHPNSGGRREQERKLLAGRWTYCRR
ncbi:hypothetical protein OG21DRAFT_1504787 [Imleria badia]|nr:hypothetical protein OG21DRAFT_1504787 [Imleria badia]